MTYDYWQECIAEAFEDAGITATDEQILTVSGWVEGAHENYRQATGQDVFSANLAASNRGEMTAAHKATERERRKVHCRECNGLGRIIINFGSRSSDSPCDKCGGIGRHDP